MTAIDERAEPVKTTPRAGPAISSEAPASASSFRRRAAGELSVAPCRETIVIHTSSRTAGKIGWELW